MSSADDRSRESDAATEKLRAAWDAWDPNTPGVLFPSALVCGECGIRDVPLFEAWMRFHGQWYTDGVCDPCRSVRHRDGWDT